MKSLTLILGCLILAALILPLLMAAAKASPSGSLKTIRRALGLHVGILRINALTSGIHGTGHKAMRADAALAARHLLVKPGSDDDHFAIGTAADEPLGVCQDEPGAAEDSANVALLGAVKGTVLMVGSEAISAGESVYAAANGEVQNEPAVVGAYWMVGKAVDDCSGDGNAFEVSPCKPVRVAVIANNADIAALKAAITSPSLIKALGA